VNKNNTNNINKNNVQTNTFVHKAHSLVVTAFWRDKDEYVISVACCYMQCRSSACLYFYVDWHGD